MINFYNYSITKKEILLAVKSHMKLDLFGQAGQWNLKAEWYKKL